MIWYLLLSQEVNYPFLLKQQIVLFYVIKRGFACALEEDYEYLKSIYMHTLMDYYFKVKTNIYEGYSDHFCFYNWNL